MNNKTGTQRVSQPAKSEVLAPIMFGLSLLFLALLGTLIVVWVDIPRFSAINDAVVENAGSVTRDPIAVAAATIGGYVAVAAWFLGFIIVGESVTRHLLEMQQVRPDNVLRWRLSLLSQCLCPPLRLAAPSLRHSGKIWLPGIGWQTPGRKLFRRLEATFSRPMLFFALLILPILLIEFGLHSYVEHHHWLRLTMHVCTGLIWCAFAIEFIVLLSASDRKFPFIKKHWIDLAIILLPVVMFLRSLRALKVMKFAKLAKAQQLTNLTRVYRVRGVAMKVFRALMVLEVFARILPVSHEKKLRRLLREREDLQEDLAELQTEIEKVRAKIAEEKQQQSQRELKTTN